MKKTFYVKGHESGGFIVVNENHEQVSGIMSFEDAKELCTTYLNELKIKRHSEGLQDLLSKRVGQIIREERIKNGDSEWEIVQDGIRSVDGQWVLVLLKQNNSDYTALKHFKVVDL